MDFLLKPRACLLVLFAIVCIGSSKPVFGQFRYPVSQPAVNVSYSPAYESPSPGFVIPYGVVTYESEPIRQQVRPVTRDRVLVIVDSNCSKCDQLLANLERPGGDFESMRNHGWRIGRELDSHIRIVDKSDVPEVLEQVSDPKFPIVLSVQKNIVSRSFQSGCTTPLDMWTFNWLITGVDTRPTPARPEPATVRTSGNYPLRGQHWSIDGDWNPSHQTVLQHVRGPAHGHQLRPEWNLDVWSYEELRSLHDNLHEAEQGSRPMAVSSQSNTFSSSGVRRYGRSAASH